MHLEWINEEDAAGNWKRSRLECNDRLVAGITRTVQTRVIQAPVRWFIETTDGLLKCNGEAYSLDMVSMLQAMIEQMVTTERQYNHADEPEADNDITAHAHQG